MSRDWSPEMARFPFGIPNSWYLVAYSDELEKDSVKRSEERRLGKECSYRLSP